MKKVPPTHQNLSTAAPLATPRMMAQKLLFTRCGQDNLIADKFNLETKG